MHGEYVLDARERVEVLHKIPPHGAALRGLNRFEPSPYPRADLGEGFREDVGAEGRSKDIAGAATEEGVGGGRVVDDIAVFFAEGAGAAEGREGVVEERGEGGDGGGVEMQEASTEDRAQDGVDLG